MQFLLCRHIKTNGIQCQAPSLTGAHYCYFHNRLHQRHTAFRHTSETRDHLLPGQHIQLTALEDRESVQVALSVVINALATGQLEPRRATALLYGLQLASSNARGLNLEPFAHDVVRTIDSSPEGIDLVEPGIMVDITPVDLNQYNHDEYDDDDDDEY
jgi:hypothetical protein